jgi:hypothetical protein
MRVLRESVPVQPAMPAYSAAVVQSSSGSKVSFHDSVLNGNGVRFNKSVVPYAFDIAAIACIKEPPYVSLAEGLAFYNITPTALFEALAWLFVGELSFQCVCTVRSSVERHEIVNRRISRFDTLIH